MRVVWLASVLGLTACSPQATSAPPVAVVVASTPKVPGGYEPETEVTTCQFDRLTRPTVDAQRLTDGVFTPAAQLEGVHGAIIIKCHIAADGVVSRCLALKALPLVTEPLIARLQATRVHPPTFDGQAIDIDYAFSFQFKVPRPP
jgi:hypothetical protein